MPSKPDVSIRVVSALDEGFINVVRRILPESGFSSTRFVTKPEGVESGFRDPWLALEACRDSRLLGGVLAELHLDGTAHAVVPRMAAGDSRSTCRVLLNRLMQELAGRGINLITVYVSMEDAETPLYLADAGFRRTHDLQVMCAPTEAVARPANRQRWVIRPCPEPVSSTLRATFARTLVGTFDFPDLRIEAPIDRVLGRFAQNGRSSDRRWYLVGQGTQLAGCLLLTDHADVDRCELGYMGLVPEFRGRGGGRWLAEYAVWQARQLGRSYVITAVDAENDPAVAAYAAAVFDPVVRRRVYFRHLIAPGDVSPCLH